MNFLYTIGIDPVLLISLKTLESVSRRSKGNIGKMLGIEVYCSLSLQEQPHNVPKKTTCKVN